MDKHYHQRDFDQRDKKAVYQGILKEGRNLRRVVESMNSVKDGLLEIIGYGGLENELKALVDKLNLNEKIKFAGKISWDKLIEETSMARAGLVIFEPDGLNYTYASPNKFFEYVSAGTPVIASDIPSFRDLIKQFEVGILVDPTSVSSIAESIEKLLNDGKTWVKIHSQCLKARLEWNWERQEARLLKIYKDLLNEI
jgi:glycosyltransferase involved in cell wall biosynthesis